VGGRGKTSTTGYSFSNGELIGGDWRSSPPRGLVTDLSYGMAASGSA